MPKRLIQLIFILIALLFAMNAHAGIILRPVFNTGLVGYWDFQEGAGNMVYDKSGYGNNGTLENMATSSNGGWIDGKIGKALNFDGTDDNVNLNTRIFTNPPTSICVWVYSQTVSNGAHKNIFNNIAFMFYINETDGADTFTIYNNNGSVSTPYASRYAFNNWYHVCGMIDSGNNASIYVNGVLAAGPTNIGARAGIDNARIGSYFTGGGEFFKGKIDEVRIYNRALNDSEVSRLYKLSQPKIGINQLGLVPDDLPSNATISYVRENCTGYSPCYNTLATWESNFGGFGWDGCTPGDLTCLNKTAVAKIDGTWNSPDPDTTYFNIDGWVTDATRYIKIYTTASARHPGKWDETKYRLEIINSDAIDIYEEYTRIDGLQFKLTTSVDYQQVLYSGVNNVNSDIRISNNIFRGNCTSALLDCEGISSGWGSVANLKIWNNLFYELNRGILINQGAVAQIYNNTIVNCSAYGFVRNGAPIMILKNNVAYNSGDNYLGTFDDYSKNNLSGPSSDADIPSTNVRNGVRVSFINEANDDFHLSPADTGARNYGTDLSNDASISYPFDIDRQNRTKNWDIGADEATGAVINASQNNQLTDGLVGFWSFNGPDIDGNEAIDRSGQGNNGTITGATRAIGKVGQALNFNGTSDWVNAGSLSSVDDIETSGSGLTFSGWVYLKSYGGQGIIMSKGTANDSGFWVIFLDEHDPSIRFLKNYDGASNLQARAYFPASYLNTWKYVVVTWDGTATTANVHFYVNTIEIAKTSTNTDGAGSKLTDAALSLGIGGTNTGSYTNGYLDEVRIYNRVLSTQEIQRLYNLGR